MFAVIDVETTGFSETNDRIVELCILVLDTDFRVTQVFDSLLNPERRIPWYATQVHGIYDSDVQHAPRFCEILPHLLVCLQGTSHFIGHKVEFDCRFLNSELTRCGTILPNNVNRIDTCHLAKQQLALQDCKLRAVATAMQLPFEDQHMACADAAVTAKIFEKLYRPRFEADGHSGAHTWPIQPKPEQSPRLKSRSQADQMKRRFLALELRHSNDCMQFAKSAVDPRLPTDVHVTWYHFNKMAISVADFAIKTKVSEGKIYDHLSKAIRAGRRVEIRKIVSRVHENKLAKLWQTCPSKKLKPKDLLEASGLSLPIGVFKCVVAQFEYNDATGTTDVNSLVSPPTKSPVKTPIQSKDSGANVRTRRKTLRKTRGVINLTDEQLLVLDSFRNQKTLKVHAFAGAGKTQTLVEIGRSTSRKGLYLSFNKKNASEAKERFPNRVECCTTHAFAYCRIRDLFSEEKLNQPLTAIAIKQALNVKDQVFHQRRWKSMEIATLTHTLLRAWLQSPMETFDSIAFPSSFLLCESSDADLYGLLTHCRLLAAQCWQKMKSNSEPIPLSHDGYLKLWAMTNPVIDTDYIMLDEAQDSNSIILDVLARQSCQKIMVGDRHQQIYEWRGAVDAMTFLNAEEERYLTRTFRFGEDIARYANAVLRRLEEPRELRVQSDVAQTGSTIARKAFLARANATIIEELMTLQDDGVSVHIQGGTKEFERLVQGMGDLQNGRASHAPELLGIRSWKELKAAVDLDQRNELAMMVRLVEQFDVDRLLGCLRKSVSDSENSDVVLSTVHKAKGLEWDCVELSDDLMQSLSSNPQNAGNMKREELRLLYVALTRASTEIILPAEIRRFLDLTE